MGPSTSEGVKKGLEESNCLGGVKHEVELVEQDEGITNRQQYIKQ